MTSAKTKLIRFVQLLALIDGVYGFYLVFLFLKRKAGLSFSSSADEDMVSQLQFAVDNWAVSRPLIFTALWILSALLMRRSNVRAIYLTALLWLIAIACYWGCWTEFGYLRANYQINSLPKPFLFKPIGMNEWDALRGVLLIVVITLWAFFFTEKRFTRNKRIISAGGWR